MSARNLAEGSKRHIHRAGSSGRLPRLATGSD